MGTCDLCNVSMNEWRRYPAARVKEAVRAGLRPRGVDARFHETLVDRAVGRDAEEAWAAMGMRDVARVSRFLADKEVTEGWAQLVMQDASDWGLCRLCAEALEERLGHVVTGAGPSEREATDAAKEAARKAGITDDRILRFRTTRCPQRRDAEADAQDAESAMKAAIARLPADAYNVGAPEIILTAARGEIEVPADSAEKAHARAPDGAALVGVECRAEPQKGFLGLGAKRGIWVFSWSRPFRARVTYELLAQVSLIYTEDDPALTRG